MQSKEPSFCGRFVLAVVQISDVQSATRALQAGAACGPAAFDKPAAVRKNREWNSRAGVTQLVECNLAKVDVAGSNPVSRSIPPINPHSFP